MNFQNIPRENKLIKRCFLPKLDKFASFDYEQIEYRILAYYLSEAVGDESMAAAFRAGEDPHKETARLILGRDTVGDKERQIGKTLNFSIIYAGGVPTILRQMAKHKIPCDRDIARGWMRELNNKMPGIRELTSMIAEEVQYKGYIYDIFGRHYRPDPYIPYHDALRKMLNALIQGSAAGLTRAAMVNIARGCRELKLQSHMVNVVHDEIIMDANETELDTLHEWMPVWMDNDKYSQVVPVSVDMAVGDNWAEKEQYA